MDNYVFALICNARKGDQNAFADLREKYRPLIESCVCRYTSADMTAQDIEDISQEALICFFSAIYSFDCELQGIEFGLYAKICVENGLTSFIRSRNRRNRIQSVPLESEELSFGETEDVLQLFVDRERTAILVRRIENLLSDYENRIWWMYVSGMSVSEIAKNNNTDNRSVSNAVYRIRRKLKENLSLNLS